MQTSGAERALARLRGPGRADLVEDVEAASILLGRVATHAEHITASAGRNCGPVRSLLDEAQRLAEQVCAAHPDSSTAEFARARAQLALGRHRRTLSVRGGKEEFQQASAHAWSAFERSRLAKHMELAVMSALEVGSVKGASMKRVYQEVQRLLKEASKAECGDTSEFQWLAVQVHVDMVSRCVECKKPAHAIEPAREGLRLLTALVEKEGASSHKAKREHTRFVTLCRDGGVKVDAEYITKLVTTKGPHFELHVPEGGHWEVDVRDIKDSRLNQVFLVLKRAEEDGARTLMVMGRYKWDTDYEFDEGTIDGASVRGLLSRHMKGSEEKLAEINLRKMPLKGRLNRTILQTAGSVLQGVTFEEEPIWRRVWFFKSRHERLTFEVHLERVGGAGGYDAEIRAILESLTELEPKEQG